MIAESDFPSAISGRIVANGVDRKLHVAFIRSLLPQTSMPFKRKIMHLASTFAPQCSAIWCFTPKKMLSTTNKDVLPMTAFINVIYLFTCACGHRYIGKTTQRLGDRMKQHIPDSLVQLVSPTAPPVRRDRGRPPRKQPTAHICAREARRSERIKEQ